MRVLKWICDRVEGRAGAQETALGWMPRHDDLDLAGLDSLTREQFDQIMRIDADEWKQELESHGELFESLSPASPESWFFNASCFS